MTFLARATPEDLRYRIAESNRASSAGSQGYLINENAVLQQDYEFVPCRCSKDCWCQKHDCNGHYIIKLISFEHFLASYVRLWIPPRARERVTKTVLQGSHFGGRQKNAIPHLHQLHQEWDEVVERVRATSRTGLCDEHVPFEGGVSDLYEAKMQSQLYYDSLVPFDSASRSLIMRSGYCDPIRDYAQMNEQLFGDLRTMADKYGITVRQLRDLDAPSAILPSLRPLAGGQPLSRVLDKVFYRPNAATNGSHRLTPEAGQLEQEKVAQMATDDWTSSPKDTDTCPIPDVMDPSLTKPILSEDPSHFDTGSPEFKRRVFDYARTMTQRRAMERAARDLSINLPPSYVQYPASHIDRWRKQGFGS